jgi:hypothetical protein
MSSVHPIEFVVPGEPVRVVEVVGRLEVGRECDGEEIADPTASDAIWSSTWSTTGSRWPIWAVPTAPASTTHRSPVPWRSSLEMSSP